MQITQENKLQIFMTHFKIHVRTHTVEMAVPNNSRHNQDIELVYGNKTMPEKNKVQFKMLHYKIMRMGSFWIAAQNS